MGFFTEVGVLSCKLLWEGSKLVVIYTPKVIVTIAQTKRELVDAIQEEIDEYEKEKKEELLEQKIKKLKRAKIKRVKIQKRKENLINLYSILDKK